jgi:hypothetical protein
MNRLAFGPDFAPRGFFSEAFYFATRKAVA